MNWYSALYWFTRLNAINTVELVFAIAALVATAITLIWWASARDDAYRSDLSNVDKRFKKPTFQFLFLTLFMWLLFILTPTKKDAALIVAGGAIGTYIQKDTTIRQIPKEILDYVRAELKAYTAKAITETSKADVENNVLKDVKEQLVQKIRNSSNDEALKMLNDSTVQHILRQ